MSYLVAVDETDVSERAVEHAERLARRDDTTLVLVHAVTHSVEAGEGTGPRLQPESEAVAQGHEVLEDARATLSSDLDAETALVYGHPIDAVPEYVLQHEVEQVFVGHRDVAHDPQAPLGSVAKHLIDAVDVPVTVVK